MPDQPYAAQMLSARARARPHHTNQAQEHPIGAATPPAEPNRRSPPAKQNALPLPLVWPRPLAAPSPAISMSFGNVGS